MPKKRIYKIILIGPGGVGKTSLLQRYVKNEFSEKYILTIGVDLLSKEIKIGRKKVKLLIWDIGGQQKFRTLHERFYTGSRGVFLVFDLTNNQSFKEMDDWLSEAYDILKGKVPFVLIGNKSDLIDGVGEVVNRDEAHHFAESKGSFYIETSAKTGGNVDNAFIKLTNQILKDAKK